MSMNKSNCKRFTTVQNEFNLNVDGVSTIANVLSITEQSLKYLLGYLSVHFKGQSQSAQ